MNLLVYTVPPLYKEKIHGGAQRILMDILNGLSKRGFSVNVVCGKPEENDVSAPCFQLGENISVFPLLEVNAHSDDLLKPYQLIKNLRILEEFTTAGDVIWSIDRGFPLDTHKPVLLSLSTLAYPFAVNALCSYNYSRLIVPSQYLYNCIKSILTRGDEISRWCTVIPNGINPDHYSPQNLKQPLFTRESNQAIHMLCPHRPDPAKGFNDVIRIARKLAKKYHIKLYIPVQSFFNSNPDFYRHLRQKAREIGTGEQVIFHEWITFKDMFRYLSGGDITFNLSSCPEGFGLIVLESIASGTPVISTKAGALREIMQKNIRGTWWLDNDYGDEELLEVFEAALTHNKLAQQGREQVITEFPVDTMIEEYAYQLEKLINSGKKVINPTPKAPGKPGHPLANIRLSPWCYITAKGNVYNDYSGIMDLNPHERELVSQFSGDHGPVPGSLDKIADDIIRRLTARGVLSSHL